MNDMKISCDENGSETGIDEAGTRFMAFSEAYDYVCRAVDESSILVETNKKH